MALLLVFMLPARSPFRLISFDPTGETGVHLVFDLEGIQLAITELAGHPDDATQPLRLHDFTDRACDLEWVFLRVTLNRRLEDLKHVLGHGDILHGDRAELLDEEGYSFLGQHIRIVVLHVLFPGAKPWKAPLPSCLSSSTLPSESM